MAPQAAGAPPLQALVRRLQEALASTEAFPVQYSAAGPSHAASSALRAFGGAGSGAGTSHTRYPDTHSNPITPCHLFTMHKWMWGAL